MPSGVYRRRSKPLAERLWSHVPERPADGCWLWVGCTTGIGYGFIQTDRPFQPGQPRMLHAHRAAWILTHGPVPDGLFVLHKCDVPACVRPDHLYVGTPAQNMRDKVERGRHRSPEGEDSGTAKLTADDVRDILRRQAAGETMADLAREFAMGETQVRSIVLGRKWKHVVVAPWRAEHGTAKIRPNRGETAGSARLRDADVLAICAAVAAKESTAEIARRYGISRGHVQKLASGAARPHLKRDRAVAALGEE